ncbi:extracellular solute-binding protein [Clostridium thermarum]|uniref:extracellular solute-binding protein n=1 Tax=Clostridium thermarum TaxID=1716543 RepID=UPI0013CF86F5|nr:extracellular solute-binding protein [Clostridium thermarum]
MRKKGILLILAAIILTGTIVVSANSPALTDNAVAVDIREADEQSIVKYWSVVDRAKIVDKIEADRFTVVGKAAEKQAGGLLLSVDDTVQFTAKVPHEGKYNLLLEYTVESDKVLKNTLSLGWEGNEALISLPSLWKDSSKDYEKDRYGNDIIPEQLMLSGMHLEYAKDHASLNKNPLTLELSAGDHKITVQNNTQPIILKAIYVVEEDNLPSYTEYFSNLAGKPAGTGLLAIEAENYVAKSDSFIRPASVQNPALHPYSTIEKRLNVIEGASWNTAGQKLMWQFEVEEPGLYYLGFTYGLNTKEGMVSFRNIELDGRIPFTELKSYPFKYTGLNYENTILTDKSGQELKLWLDKGVHSLAMEVEGEPFQAVIEELEEIMTGINDAGIDIKKLTGGKEDKNRTWDVEQYMPDIVERLEGWARQLEELYEKLEIIGGEEPSYAVNLKVSAKNLRDIASEPKKIPSQLNKLSEGTGSVAQLIADLNLSLRQQPLSLDRIYIIGDEKMQSASAGLFRNLLEHSKRFVASFSDKNKGYGGVEKEEDELNVWVNRPIQYVELLQQMADSDFTLKTGIRVKFSVMPNEQKLTLSNASRTNPDVALGISNYIPYQLAIRGAAADLTQFKDFLPYMSKEYNLETLIPFIEGEKIYGVTETQDFYVLMYRKDILDKFNLEVPNTWEDVKNMMPQLQRHSMNFFVPMAAWSGLKPFYTTSPFLFQNGGSIYSEDGLTTAINTEQTIKGFELMTELFNIYSLAENAPNFYNNFRYGIMPIGVSNFGTYVTLTNAAPEIAGQWGIALSPGVEDEDGNIQRFQVGSDRAALIFENSDKKDQGWEFLKWWLSKDVQVKYAYALQTKFGPEYMWNTANMAAFEELPLPEKDKEVILEQWKYIKEVAPHPASYMAEREISNAWTNIVMDGDNLRTTIDRAAVVINREIKLKLEEFGYIKEGKVIKEYKIPTVEDIKRMVRESQ